MQNKPLNSILLKGISVVFLVLIFFGQAHTGDEKMSHRITPAKYLETGDRPVITGIVLNVAYPDGTTRTYTIDPKNTEALFWSDLTVIRILAPFYKKNPKQVSEKWVIKNYGRKAGRKLIRLFGIPGKNTVNINDKFIITAWKMTGSGFIYAGMKKHPTCDTTPL